ncbi:S8 family peptidase [Gandjariella thermophila]|uniref:Serine protease n=1 Tax=Gandjariella thermophila TaxID=1931992 RepID=A0A4D4J4M0_9PSEU|nr:S8 family serine peptidase [Gandjariella thermophila]GDY31471.1 serine protease [Gandjariella thermophila]
MPLLHRARVAAVSAALVATSCLAVVPPAAADPGADPGGCVDRGPMLRYLVVFDRGTPGQTAHAAIGTACGSTVVYYPQIAVAVAASPDPRFADRMGRDHAYSAQAEALAGGGGRVRRKPDETQSGQLPAGGTVDPADRTAEQWDMAMIRADRAHAITEGSRDVLVGVLDSGVDPTHPDLAAAVDPARSAGCTTGAPDRDRPAWVPTTSPHGTHVAGIIAAADDGRGITGVAPGVRLASVKVVDDDGYIYPEAAVCGFMWAATTGMTITNSSYFVDPWVFACPDEPGQSVVYEAVRRAVDYAASRGVLNIAAATNTGADLSAPETDASSPDNAAEQRTRRLGDGCDVLPAGLRGVVTVSSVGARRLKAGYSSYGLGVVDLTAPGGDRRQRPDGPGRGCVLSTVPGGYRYSCGTSMAAPHAAGVAALLASSHPHSTVTQLTRMLGQQADTVPCPADYDLNGTGVQDAYCTGYSGYNGFYGHGLVDALAAVTPGAAPSH